LARIADLKNDALLFVFGELKTDAAAFEDEFVLLEVDLLQVEAAEGKG
jgi:hypothetical protein